MKRIFIFLISSVFAFSLGAQELDEILESHFEAIGQDKVLETNAFKIKAKVNQGGMEIPLILFQYRPNMYKSIVEVQGQQIISAYDGENGWMVNPLSGTTDPIKLSGEQLKDMKDKADIDGKLYNWEEKGHKLEYAGTEEMEGTEVYVLELDTKEGDKITYYVDVDSYLILKEKNKKMVQGAEREFEAVFSNYNDVDGMIFPFSLIVMMGGQAVTDLVFEEIIINPDIDESFFMMPEVKTTDESPQSEDDK